jgi:hypothetical protein
MLVFSNQIRIIKNIYFSYKNNKVSYTKLTDKELSRYQRILEPKKFQNHGNTDFKLLVLLILLDQEFSSLTSFLVYLQNKPLVDLKRILSRKEDILYYKNTYNADIENTRIYDIPKMDCKKRLSFSYSLYNK